MWNLSVHKYVFNIQILDTRLTFNRDLQINCIVEVLEVFIINSKSCKKMHFVVKTDFTRPGTLMNYGQVTECVILTYFQHDKGNMFVWLDCINKKYLGKYKEKMKTKTDFSLVNISESIYLQEGDCLRPYLTHGLVIHPSMGRSWIPFITFRFSSKNNHVMFPVEEKKHSLSVIKFKLNLSQNLLYNRHPLLYELRILNATSSEPTVKLQETSSKLSPTEGTADYFVIDSDTIERKSKILLNTIKNDIYLHALSKNCFWRW